MKFNIALAAVFGAAAASVFALPAQAATVFSTTTNVGGTVSAAAYQIQALSVGTSTYTVDFNHGIFDASPETNPNDSSVYKGILPTLSSGAALTAADAQTIGKAIVDALNAAGVVSVVERINPAPTYGRDIVNQFYIPFVTNPNLGQASENLVAFCTIANPYLTGPNSPCDATQSLSKTANVMYATFTAVPNSTAVPTPALLPGLVGLSLAALRKKQQVAAVDA
jgi:hypothetical protein